ncbi:MAG: hypothetical protein GY711_31355 [bacterium]|nr:hypothetical protein [bacterium]
MSVRNNRKQGPWTWALMGGLATATASWTSAQERLDASDGWMSDSFGFSVAVDGNELLTGAFRDDDLGTDVGAAYVLTRDANGWSETTKLVPSDAAPYSWFGFETAIHGTTAIVSAPGRGPSGAERGGVYAFERSGAEWAEVALLRNNDGAKDDLYGRSVSVSGDWLAVGAERADDAAVDGGAVYIYERDSSDWLLQAVVVAPDANKHDYFGHAVALEGRHLIVTAYADDDSGTNSGSAYYFRRQNNRWTLKQKFSGSTATHHDNFGSSISMADDVAVIGAPGSDAAARDAGAAFVFERRGSRFVEFSVLTADDAAAEDGFGVSAASGEAMVIIGASHEDGAGANRGAAYVFVKEGLDWKSAGVTRAADGGTDYAYFGLDVAASPHDLVAGAFGAAGLRPGEGAVWVFDANGHRDYPVARPVEPDGPVLEWGTWAVPYCLCETSAPCGNVDASAGCANSTGRGGLLAAHGTPSVANDDLTLRLSTIPKETPAQLYMGAPMTAVNLFSGPLCVGTGAYGRYPFPVLVSNADGEVTFGPSLADHTARNFPNGAQIVAGTSWGFQALYRDDASPCRWILNWSNAVLVTFHM